MLGFFLPFLWIIPVISSHGLYKLSCPVNESSIDTVGIYKALKAGVFEHELDPVRTADLPVQDIEFHYQLTDHKGKVTLTEGWVQDMSTLLEDAPISFECDQNSMVLHLPIGFEHITTSWEYALKSGIHTPNGRLRTTHDGIRLELIVNISLDTGKLTAQTLQQVETGILQITSTNLGAIEQPVNFAMADLFMFKLVPVIIQEFEAKVQQIFDSLPPIDIAQK